VIGVRKVLIDETGNVYGRWTVISRAPNRYGATAMWNVRCECGAEAAVVGSSLRNKTSKGCDECWRGRDVEALIRELFARYKKQAKDRGLIFDIPMGLFVQLIAQKCWYCGIEPARFFREATAGKILPYNGIDRFDNKKGYLSENVVTCCATCNWGKNAMSGEEFLAWVNRLITRWSKEQAS
jgi:hypothetical protein